MLKYEDIQAKCLLISARYEHWIEIKTKTESRLRCIDINGEHCFSTNS